MWTNNLILEVEFNWLPLDIKWIRHGCFWNQKRIVLIRISFSLLDFRIDAAGGHTLRDFYAGVVGLQVASKGNGFSYSSYFLEQKTL